MGMISQEELLRHLFTEEKTGAFDLLRRMEMIEMETEHLRRPMPTHVKTDVCSLHGDKAVVFYEGPACPYCLALDDLDFTRESLAAKGGE